MCEVCETHVLDSAKHCGACNRCVHGFDHHCRWLNNCVGAANYRLFFRLICSVFLMALLHNVTNGFSLYFMLTRDVLVGHQHETIFTVTLHVEFAWLLAVAVFFNLCVFLFLGHLICFHLLLQRKGMTTFEYIRWKEDRKKASKIVKRK